MGDEKKTLLSKEGDEVRGHQGQPNYGSDSLKPEPEPLPKTEEPIEKKTVRIIAICLFKRNKRLIYGVT